MIDTRLAPFTPGELSGLTAFLTEFLSNRGFTVTETSGVAKQHAPSMTSGELGNLVHHTASEFLSALNTGPDQGADIYL